MHKLHFLYNYYFEIPLKRNIYLLRSAKQVKKITDQIKQNKNIPQLSSEFTARHNVNIHILCSHQDLESSLLSLASFYTFSKEYAEIVIHEDGTFVKEDVSIIKKTFPWITYISLKDANKCLQEKGFSNEVIKLRYKHKLLIKAIDFHHIESKDRILIIDTDVFFLGKLEELWGKINEGAKLIFNKDPEPAYGNSKQLLEKAMGRKIAVKLSPYINTGLIVEPASFLRNEKETIENYCKEFKNFVFQRVHCIEQGYIACILKDKKIKEYPLSSRYKIVSSRDNQIVNWLRKYNFQINPGNIQTIHLGGWNKLGKDFQMVKKKLLYTICEAQK